MISQAILLFIFCLALAFVEVQIEGKHGWAEKFPTWKPFEKKWYAKIFKMIFYGKGLSGYHIGINLLVLVAIHGFYFYRVTWSWQAEAQVWSIFFLTVVVWDFLWFVINPHFGWKKFKPIFIAWHKPWLGPWPLDYYVGLILFIILFMLSYWPDWYLGLGDSLYYLLLVFIPTLILTIVRIIYDNRKRIKI